VHVIDRSLAAASTRLPPKAIAAITERITKLSFAMDVSDLLNQMEKDFRPVKHSRNEYRTRS
jgi:hypothetical protein